MYCECRSNPATSLEFRTWRQLFHPSVDDINLCGEVVRNLVFRVLCFTLDCGILWFRLWIFSWEDSNVSKHWTLDKWNEKQNRFLWRPWSSCARCSVVVRSVCVCVRAHRKTTRSGYAWVYVLSSWPVKGSLTSLIMGVNICRGINIKSNW